MFVVNEEIPEGHIIVAACKDDCATSLSMNSKLWFSKMGSTEIWNVKYRQSYVFIGIYGRMGECIERRSKSKTEKVHTTKVFTVKS